MNPEVSTLSTLTNVQNSLFIPDLGRFLNRRLTYELSPRVASPADTPDMDRAAAMSMAPSTVSTAPSVPAEPRPPTAPKSPKTPRLPAGAEKDEGLERPRQGRTLSIGSTMSDTRYAVLPHGVTLLGWSEEDKELLNDHVRHMLHSKRSAFKRSMKGFWKYVQKPLGFFVTLYAVLITLFGLAWVLFLIGWINVGGRQLYIINVIDNVLVALFAIMGDGLAPFRAVDTYHMIFIAHYHYYSWRRRNEERLPKLRDHNDLPTEIPSHHDVEAGVLRKQELSVLTPKQQSKLDHHAAKYSKSHTFYRPHETETHYAFPVKLLITVTVLLDFHSIFQIALGACTWGIDWHHRPAAITATILCCSISCNISAGIVIAVGDRMTRKKEIIELQFRQALTRSAIKKVQKEKRKEAETAPDPDAIPIPGTHAVVTEEAQHDDDQSILDDEHNQVTVVGDSSQIDRVVERMRNPERFEVSDSVPTVKKPTPTQRVTAPFKKVKDKVIESVPGIKPYPGT
ncbi:putative integral membrane protein [Phaeomoniella chlamydospora]|uniref:Putative integral membrane protein n=1 Tax=Phaeomoniella chlamydospora TaxID=158046 RepID=A0A0G2EQB9_PHACM|nr:putative integral membrane protein [Phaeomoniella chlamydospora]